MRQVSLTLHYVATLRSAFPVRVDDLRSLYRTAGIDLQISLGEDIGTDPRVSTLRNFGYWIKRFNAASPRGGHLMIVDLPFDAHPYTGELLDSDWRCTAAVYTSSSYIRQDIIGHFFQTCAHEIGHMLNLAHEDADASFPTVMKQAAGRPPDTASSWFDAEDDAKTMASKGLTTFFEPPERSLPCHPFSFTERRRLNTSSEISLQPGQGAFERLAGGIDDCPWCRDRRL